MSRVFVFKKKGHKWKKEKKFSFWILLKDLLLSLSVNLEDLHYLQRGGKKPFDFLVVGSVEGNDPLAGMCTELSNVFSTSDTHFPWSSDDLDSSHG